MVTSLAYLIGMFAGILAICIAIYLEWVIDRACNARYVYAYLFLGIGLILVSVNDIINPGIAYARTIGFFVILILEIYGFVHLYRRIKSEESPPDNAYGG